MAEPVYLQLSRRESQIMAAVYQIGEATVAEVVERLPERPAYNSVRNTMTILERKGYLKHRRRGQKYVYHPVGSPERAMRSAVSHLLDTFFAGSLPRAVQAMLGAPDRELTDRDLNEIERLIQETRKARN